MADVHGGVLIAVTVQEQHHIVAAGALDHGHVAGGAGIILKPLAEIGVQAAAHGASLQGVIGVVGVSLLGAFRHIVGGQLAKGSALVLGGLHRGGKLIGLGLGGVHGGLLLLFGGLHGVALLVGGAGSGAVYGDIAVVIAVQGGGVLLVIGLQVFLGDLLLIGVGGLVIADQSVPLHAGPVIGDGHISAVVGSEVALQVGIAVFLGGGLGGVDALLHGCLVLLGQGEALLSGRVLQGGRLGQLGNGLLHKVVVVALGLLLVHILGVQIRGGIKGGTAGVIAHIVLLGQGGAEVVFHVVHIVIPASHADGGGAALEDAGVPDQQNDHQHGDDHADDRVENSLAFGGLLFLQLLALLLGQTLSEVALALLFFSGCAH